MFHGKGGYDWETVYNMPIWLRKFTFESIKKFYEDEARSKQPHNIVEDKKEFKKPNIDTSRLPNYKQLEKPQPYIVKTPIKK